MFENIVTENEFNFNILEKKDSVNFLVVIFKKNFNP